MWCIRFVSLGLLAFGVAASAGAQVRPTDPGFASSETLTYTETIGPKTRPYVTALNRSGSGTGARLDFSIQSADLDATYHLDPTTLVSLASEQTAKAPDATVRRTAEYKDVKPQLAADELAITDLGSLPVVLRGYPFARTAVTRLAYIGNTSYGGGAVSFEVQVVGREPVVAQGRIIDCFKMTSGLGGALAMFLAKTEYWYAVEGNHPLIKLSGPSGGPGSPTRTLLLQKIN